MIWFRNADRRYPFLWETDDQPPGRWHGEGEGPAQYLASTPDGAWAEFLRREEITHPADLDGIDRALWAVDVDESEERIGRPRLKPGILRGGLASYEPCQAEARRLRENGVSALQAPSAGLLPGAARGQTVDGRLVEGLAEDGRVLVLFGPRPGVRGWACCFPGRPSERVLGLVRPFSSVD